VCAQDPFAELEKTADFLERAFPVLGREGEDGERADTAVDAGVDDLDEPFGSAAMAFEDAAPEGN
jgi:hypothetical protein